MGGRFHKSDFAENAGPDNHCCQSHDHRAHAAVYIGGFGLLAQDGPCQRRISVADGQADDFHPSRVLGNRSDKLLVVPCRPKQKAGLGFQVQVQA